MGWWPELQRLERAGKSIAELQAWLLEQGCEVGKSAVHRCLDRIRTSASQPPPVKPELPALEPASDEDELKLLRSHFWRQAVGAGIAPKDQQGAARLLLSIRAEKRAAKPVPPPQPTATSSPTTAAPPPRSQAELDAIAQRDLN